MVDPKFGEVEDMILEALEEAYVVLGEFVGFVSGCVFVCACGGEGV